MWSYLIREISTPSLLQIRIQFILKFNGADYVPDEVYILPSELEGLTNVQKLTLIRGKIETKCNEYIKVYTVANGLKVYEGQTVNM
ncbi:MAG: hypothetical protein HZB36_00965 [Candidatus Omnitrophica bacterium]|nr:hypothetical protein [Candidatus Omnitrophota bacterium]